MQILMYIEIYLIYFYIFYVFLKTFRWNISIGREFIPKTYTFTFLILILVSNFFFHQFGVSRKRNGYFSPGIYIQR